MKLHLGCGQRYFKGYINIDYPLSEHSVQQSSVADEHANLFELNYKKESIDEIRLHHVFEHFSRAQATALLGGWNSWLKNNGVVHIEVPDFYRTGKAALSGLNSFKTQSVALRHIFGSQEAHWALHFEGYTPKRLSYFIELFGFKTQQIKKNKHFGTYNFEIIAVKIKSLTKEECITAGKIYLKNFMVADVDSERILYDVWIADFVKQLERTYTING